MKYLIGPAIGVLGFGAWVLAGPTPARESTPDPTAPGECYRRMAKDPEVGHGLALLLCKEATDPEWPGRCYYASMKAMGEERSPAGAVFLCSKGMPPGSAE